MKKHSLPWIYRGSLAMLVLVGSLGWAWGKGGNKVPASPWELRKLNDDTIFVYSAIKLVKEIDRELNETSYLSYDQMEAVLEYDYLIYHAKVMIPPLARTELNALTILLDAILRNVGYRGSRTFRRPGKAYGAAQDLHRKFAVLKKRIPEAFTNAMSRGKFRYLLETYSLRLDIEKVPTMPGALRKAAVRPFEAYSRGKKIEINSRKLELPLRLPDVMLKQLLYYDYLLYHADVMIPPLTDDEYYPLSKLGSDLLVYISCWNSMRNYLKTLYPTGNFVAEDEDYFLRMAEHVGKGIERKYLDLKKRIPAKFTDAMSFEKFRGIAEAGAR